jgi:hypothetical protein
LVNSKSSTRLGKVTFNKGCFSIARFIAKVALTVYKTYAFYNSGIDQLKMSDLDKKRVLRAIDRELQAKGYTKSTEPDFMINIFTKSKEVSDVYSTNYLVPAYMDSIRNNRNKNSW